MLFFSSYDKARKYYDRLQASNYCYIYYNEYVRTFLALILSAGKLFQAAGQDTLGIIKFLEYLGSTNTVLNRAILIPLIFVNVIINSSTRVNKIVEYCMLPTVYCGQNFCLVSDSPPDVMKSYVISMSKDSLTLYYVDYAAAWETVDLPPEALDDFRGFKHIILDNGRITDSELETETPLKISNKFNYAEHALFANIIKQAKSDNLAKWKLLPRILYWLLYGGCILSIVFTVVAAYLSAITLLTACYAQISPKIEVFLGIYVMICAFYSYKSFNLYTMHKSVHDLCSRFNDAICSSSLHAADSFTLPGCVNNFCNKSVALILVTFLMTVLGIAAGEGMAYFSITKALKVLPGIKNMSADWQKIIIDVNVFIAIFPNIFMFASGVYIQLKNFISKPADKDKRHNYTVADCLLTFLIIVDSVANSCGPYLGTQDLLKRFFNSHHNSGMSQTLFNLNICIIISNFILNFGMIKTGSEQAFTQANRIFGCCNKYTLYMPLSEEEYKTPMALT